MAILNIGVWIQYSWAVLAAIWLVTMPFTKRTEQSLTGKSLAVQRTIFLVGFFLIGSDYFRQGWLGHYFLREYRPVQTVGLAFTAAGCLFAIWARLILGANWSGTARVKEGHELIVKGPYRLVRHPIYTGIMFACIGTTLAIGEWGCLLGLVVILLGLAIKMAQEERLMLATFPQAYPQYRRRVKALIPGLL
jgi:protein-S-isoprenylcysteine O-methyltransferase Ste14